METYILDLRAKPDARSHMFDYIISFIAITFAFLFFAIALPTILTPMQCDVINHHSQQVVCR